MQLLKITKGNYNTTKTIEQYLPEKTLRFHFTDNEKHFEYAIENMNKSTINLYCTQLNRLKCKSRCTLVVAACLVIEEKKIQGKEKKV